MNAAGTLKRAVVIGLMITMVSVGSAIMQPATTAAAGSLPGSQTAAADIGYPTCSGCRVQMQPNRPASIGDEGYPHLQWLPDPSGP